MAANAYDFSRKYIRKSKKNVSFASHRTYSARLLLWLWSQFSLYSKKIVTSLNMRDRILYIDVYRCHHQRSRRTLDKILQCASSNSNENFPFFSVNRQPQRVVSYHTVNFIPFKNSSKSMSLPESLFTPKQIL